MGVSYYNNSYTRSFNDYGQMVITVGVDPQSVVKTIKGILDELKNIRTNIGGTFTYSSTFNSTKTIIGKIVSGFTGVTSYNFFDKNNFTKPLQFSMGYTGGSTAANYIVHSLPNKNNTSFSNCGVIGSAFNYEEYVEIYGSTLNSGKFKIYGLVKLKDNKELLYSTNTFTNENLFTSNTTLNYYIRGESDVSIIEKPQAALGAYNIYNTNLVKQDCFDNQNEYQTFLRSQAIGTAYYAYWLPCQSCGNFVESSSYPPNGNKTLDYANSIYFSIVQVATNPNTSGITPYQIYTNRSYTSTSSAVSSVSFGPANLKIDLSHQSLQGWSVDLYSDVNLTQRLTTSYYRSGSPGFDQSYILLIYSTSLPKTLYCVFNGPIQLTLGISLTN